MSAKSALVLLQSTSFSTMVTRALYLHVRPSQLQLLLWLSASLAPDDAMGYC